MDHLVCLVGCHIRGVYIGRDQDQIVGRVGHNVLLESCQPCVVLVKVVICVIEVFQVWTQQGVINIQNLAFHCILARIS